MKWEKPTIKELDPKEVPLLIKIKLFFKSLWR